MRLEVSQQAVLQKQQANAARGSGRPTVAASGSEEVSLASRRGQDKQGFHRSDTNPLHFDSCFRCAHFATYAIFCHMLPCFFHMLSHFPVGVDCRDSRHFCDDPACPDPVRTLSKVTAEAGRPRQPDAPPGHHVALHERQFHPQEPVRAVLEAGQRLLPGTGHPADHP